MIEMTPKDRPGHPLTRRHALALAGGAAASTLAAPAQASGPGAVLIMNSGAATLSIIDMPTRTELIANNKSLAEIGEAITADKVIYQDLADLIQAVQSVSHGRLNQFDASCFNGEYVTGDIDTAYLDALEDNRKRAKQDAKPANDTDE